MENVRSFIQFLQKFVHLPEEEFNHHVRPYLQTRQFRKKQVITPHGEVENFFNFISRGIVRKYFKKGTEEINMQISAEGHFIYSNESFYNRTPSEFVVEAVEASTLLSINFDDLEKIFSSAPKLERMGRLMVTFDVILKDRSQVNMIKLTPRERFLNFVKKHPELLKRVPQKYLASYLNIQPETFSRFKHLLREKV